MSRIVLHRRPWNWLPFGTHFICIPLWVSSCYTTLHDLIVIVPIASPWAHHFNFDMFWFGATWNIPLLGKCFFLRVGVEGSELNQLLFSTVGRLIYLFPIFSHNRYQVSMKTTGTDCLSRPLRHDEETHKRRQPGQKEIFATTKRLQAASCYVSSLAIIRCFIL